MGTQCGSALILHGGLGYRPSTFRVVRMCGICSRPSGPCRGVCSATIFPCCLSCSRTFLGPQTWWAIADRIGGFGHSLAGPSCQALAIDGFVLTRDELSLFAISAAFGFAFAGIIPAYAVACEHRYLAVSFSGSHAYRSQVSHPLALGPVPDSLAIRLRPLGNSTTAMVGKFAGARKMSPNETWRHAVYGGTLHLCQAAPMLLPDSAEATKTRG